MTRVAGVLLAAGASRRLGQPKALVELGGRPLVRRVAETALALPVDPLVVVVGALGAEIEGALHGLPVRLVRNPAPERGMASSIAVGIAALDENAVDAALVLLVDQPKLTTSHLATLVDASEEATRVTASAWDDALGPPALFPRAHWAALASLAGDRGARAWLREHPDVVPISFPGGAFDLDTPEDLAALRGELGATSSPER